MTDARATLAIIDEFVQLAVERRLRALPSEQRERMEVLDESLRDLIDGAKPAPKRIENPSAAAGAAPSGPSAPSAPVVKASMASALSDALDSTAGSNDLSLTGSDKKKVRDVSVLDDSAYTRPTAPAYMQDYFSEDIVPMSSTKDLVPTAVINAEGESVDLSREVRVLFGLEKPRPAPSPARPAATSRPASAAPAAKGAPVIVHLLAGGTKRGQVQNFSPNSGKVSLTMKDGSNEEVTLQEVLAIFFGARRGQESIDAEGIGLVVKLVNDRQLSGLSPDYSEGADALTVVPSPKRGNIDHIWVPAWAVKAVELT